MNEFKKTFISTQGLEVSIVFSDTGEKISVFDNNELLLGEIHLQYFPSEDGYGERYYITNLGLDRCSSQGIGQKCLEFHIDFFGGVLTAANNDGLKRCDGSHLTGDGVGFIEAMRKKDIVAKDNTYKEDYE